MARAADRLSAKGIAPRGMPADRSICRALFRSALHCLTKWHLGSCAWSTSNQERLDSSKEISQQPHPQWVSFKSALTSVSRRRACPFVPLVGVRAGGHWSTTRNWPGQFGADANARPQASKSIFDIPAVRNFASAIAGVSPATFGNLAPVTYRSIKYLRRVAHLRAGRWVRGKNSLGLLCTTVRPGYDGDLPVRRRSPQDEPRRVNGKRPKTWHGDDSSWSAACSDRVRADHALH